MSKTKNQEKPTGSGAKLGVFLCECGGRIDGKIDLAYLKKTLKGAPEVDYVDILPYSCMLPGLTGIRKAVSKQKLERVIVAGCERRILLGKFEKELKDTGLAEGQIDVVNVRDYVAAVNRGAPEALAEKGAKLILAAAAGLKALIPSAPQKVEIKGPVMILGGGMATYSAAQEFARNGIEALMAVYTEDIEDEIRILHERYPGERHYHDRLMKIMTEVDSSPLIKHISVGELQQVMGSVGNYTVTFSADGDGPPRVYQAGAIVAALDGEMLNQGSEFGHDGKRVLCHTEMEEYIWLHGVPSHRMVFWINDLETDRPYAHLSARTAWNMALYMCKNNANCDVTILYNNTTTLPLSAAERVQARKMNIRWVPYDAKVRPTVQDGYITYDEPGSQIERELLWDQLVLSPKRHPGMEQLKVARILGLDVHGEEFLERNPQMVRPEQVGVEEKFLAGSARNPCDLRETLRQGRRAAQKTAEIVNKSLKGELYAPRMVCIVDQSKCIGCGLCKEICDCGGIAPVEGPGGNIPRVVDPMTCTGGGTCAAACPYGALSLQNNTTKQREARVTALANRLAEGEIMGFGCRWGGSAAADNAGVRGIPYDERFHLLPIDCIGQLDPVVMGRAFLEGANGLLLLGCPPEECHHSYGLDHTWSRVLLVKKLFTLIGLERDRIALAHMDLNQPEQLAKTVNRFMEMMDAIGPIVRDDVMKAKIRDLYDTLNNPRVRWVLGASLRRPWETTYPADQRNALAFDETFSDVVMEEFLRTRLVNYLRREGKVLHLNDIVDSVGEEKQRVLHCLKDLSDEGMISRIYKDRVPYYTLQ